MGTDFIPGKEANLGAWLNTLVTGCNAHKTILGFTDPEIADYQVIVEDWTNYYAAWEAARVALDAALQLKLQTLAAAKAMAREINTRVQANKNISGDLKAVRLALTGRERGPELWAVIAALPRDELLRRAQPLR